MFNYLLIMNDLTNYMQICWLWCWIMPYWSHCHCTLGDKVVKMVTRSQQSRLSAAQTICRCASCAADSGQHQTPGETKLWCDLRAASISGFLSFFFSFSFFSAIWTSRNFFHAWSKTNNTIGRERAQRLVCLRCFPHWCQSNRKYIEENIQNLTTVQWYSLRGFELCYLLAFKFLYVSKGDNKACLLLGCNLFQKSHFNILTLPFAYFTLLNILPSETT